MDFMEMMAKAANGGDQDEGPSLTEFQQIARMREVLGKKDELHAFSRGDVLAHKFPDEADTRDAGTPAIFVRYLSEPVEPCLNPSAFEGLDDYGSNVAAHRLDCVVGKIRGGRYVEYLERSENFEPAGGRFGKID